jgi:hypothetical protein
MYFGSALPSGCRRRRYRAKACGRGTELMRTLAVQMGKYAAAVNLYQAD